MSYNFLPVIVQFLRIRRAHNRQYRFPTDRHCVHDFLEGLACADVLRLQRTCAGFEMKRRNWRKADGGQQ